MKISDAERKQIENEMIFRRINEKLGSDLDNLDRMHREDGHVELQHDDLILISFQCECSDENCSERIPITLSKYQGLHTNRNDYIVRNNHEVDDIEKVIREEKNYKVVQKKNSTPAPNNILNKTTIDNSHNNS